MKGTQTDLKEEAKEKEKSCVNALGQPLGFEKKGPMKICSDHFVIVRTNSTYFSKHVNDQLTRGRDKMSGLLKTMDSQKYEIFTVQREQ